MIRHVFTLLIALSLALGSVSLASARVAAIGQMVVTLCSDGAAVSVTLDAQGNPVPASHHHCPDCLAGLAVGVLPKLAVLARLADQAQMRWPLAVSSFAQPPAAIPQARAPPFVIF